MSAPPNGPSRHAARSAASDQVRVLATVTDIVLRVLELFGVRF